jgi:GNAT superfamily N-acetyltransferase
MTCTIPDYMEITENISLTDKEPIRSLLEKSGFFYPFEVEVVMGLIDETTRTGSLESGYYWLKLEENNEIAGFVNYGPNPCSAHSWDLYWIAVDPLKKGKGLGTELLLKTEEKVKEMGGRILWIETSGRPLYQPTVSFYLQKGYRLAATLDEFYGPGDPKLIFTKTLID